MRLNVIHTISFVLICVLLYTNAEVFTAISEVEPLLETHKKIIDDLDYYIGKEKKRIISLKKHLNIYKREHEKAMEDIPNYLGNPLNAFTLIKRLTTDLDEIEKSINIGTDYIKNITMTRTHVKYPSLEDLAGAANALTRLQNTYKLDIKELSEGVLNGVRYSSPMSAGDCYELGRALYNDSDFKHAIEWMMEAYRKFKDENDDTYSFNEVDILEYISFSYYLIDDIRTAIKWTYQLLAVDPNHERAQKNEPNFKKYIAEEDERIRREQRGETGTFEDSKPKIAKRPETLDRQERAEYEALCRGEMDIPKQISSKLYCRYLTENHPFLKLAPIKMEQRYIKPDVFVFHNVMSDDEIKLIKEMAKPRFKRALVKDSNTGESIPAHYRISKSSWIKDQESERIAKISQRVADFTGLNMMSAEELQVVNYGIGGHYEPHYDFSLKNHEHTYDRFEGKRIATVLFYMSEVAQGGATVFTELGLSVFPVKYAALYWLNLHPSGQGDLATRHAACPVLRGSKWVSNKWIHEAGQELIRPCDLEFQDEGIIRKIPKPIPKSFR